MEAPLFSRDDELLAIDDVMFGRVNGIAFTGEPGVGRSVLLDEAERRANEIGITVFRVYGTPSASSIEFGAAAALVPEAVGLDRLSVLRNTEDWLLEQTGEHGGVLLVDDAHDLDAATTALVHTIAAARRLRVVLTVSTARRVPSTLTRLWKDRLVRRCELAPLDRATTRRLLEQLVEGTASASTERAVWELTVGTPMYVSAIVDECVFQADGGLVELIGDPLDTRRLREIVNPQLDDATDPMIEALGCLALRSPLDVTLVDETVGSAVTVQLERSGLVHAEHGRLRPRHPMVAHVALAALPTVRRREIARRMADTLVDREDLAPTDLVRAVGWLLDADIPVDPATTLAAATHAFALGDSTAAARIAETTMDVGPDRDRWKAAFVLAKARRQLGDSHAAEAAFRIAADAPTESDRVDVGIARAESIAIAGGRFEAGLALLAELADSTREPELSRRLAIERTFLSSVVGDFREVAAASETLLDDADLDDLTTVVAANGLTFARVMLLQVASYDQDLSRLRAAAERVEDAYPLAVDQLDLITVVARITQGRVDEAVERCVERRHRDVDPTWGCGEGSWAAIEAFARAFQSAPGAEAIARHAIITLAGADPMGLRYVGTGIAALALLQAGHVSEADEVLANVSPPKSEGDRRSDVLIRARLEAWQLALDGDHAGAAELVVAAGRNAVEEGHVLWGVLGLYDAVRFGHPAAAGDELRRVATDIGAGSELLDRFCHHADAAIAGDADALGEVATRFDSMGATLFAAEAWCATADAFARSGVTDDAHRAAARAQMLGAGRLPPTPSRITTSAALTDRQVEIVMLVLDGMTSRDVATRLSLSIRTVENHIATVYRNLGVSNRDQLASAVGSARGPGTID